MRKPFLAFLVLYLSTFLFLQEEIHGLSHHLREINHTHSLKCFFNGGEEKKAGLTETCYWHDLFIRKDSYVGVTFFRFPAPKLLNETFIYPEKITLSENFIFYLPFSRGPPVLS